MDRRVRLKAAGGAPLKYWVVDGDPLRTVLRAAATALEPVLGDVDLTAGEPLTGSDRNLIVRAVARDRRGRQHPVVVKAAIGAGDGSAREEAALGLLTARGVPGVVRLVAAGVDRPVLVLEDLGAGPTLADRLLDDDPGAARAAVLGRAEALGSLHARTAGLRDPFAARLASLSPLGVPSLDPAAGEIEGAVGVLRRGLARLDLAADPAALAELSGIAAALDVSAAGRPGALAPGDTCPSNAVDTGGGLTLIDFEGAAYRHVAWDAAYLLVPWPSCWCAWRLPDAVAAAALDRWRQVLAPTLPVVATAAFDLEVVRAALGWVFISASWFLDAALDGDPPPADPARRAVIPPRRAILQHRLGWAADQTRVGLPALRELAAAMRDAMYRRWGDHPLPLAPAFR